jgi:hypothetical protein
MLISKDVFYSKNYAEFLDHLTWLLKRKIMWTLLLWEWEADIIFNQVV